MTIDRNVRPQPRRSLTEADAIDIWIARWLRVRVKDLVFRYGCDSRRLYDVWWGVSHPGSRPKAQRLFAERYPELAGRTAFGYRRIPSVAGPGDGQRSLFDT
jgi:hypothetical protein